MRLYIPPPMSKCKDWQFKGVYVVNFNFRPGKVTFIFQGKQTVKDWYKKVYGGRR